MENPPITPMENTAQTMRDVILDMDDVQVLSGDPTTASPDYPLDTPFLVAVPRGREVKDLSQAVEKALTRNSPARRTGCAQLSDLSSLISWANRFKSSNSALFANPIGSTPSLTCIANYHLGGDETFDHGISDVAQHCDHRGVYSFPLSKEWLAWTRVSGKKLPKDDMGEFIEANAKDIQDPTPAILASDASDPSIQDWEKRLIETANQIGGRYGQLQKLLAMSRQFAVYETSQLEATSNRDTGEQSIKFVNEHRDADGAPIKIPNLIIITIPVFEGGALYRMPVRFRYAKSGSNLSFVLSMYAPEKAFDDAFNGAAEEASKETDLPLFYGSAES